MEKSDLEKELYNYFEKDIAEPNEKELLMLKQTLKTAPNKNEKFLSIKKFSLAFLILILLIPAISIPIILNNNVRYYSDSNLNKTELSAEKTINIINNEFSEYNEILSVCTLCYSYGLYFNETLISIICSFEKNDIPFTALTLQIDMTNKYINSNKDLYKLNALETKTKKYVLYEKTITEPHSNSYLKLLDFGDYTIYLNTNIDDNDIFKIFL